MTAPELLDLRAAARESRPRLGEVRPELRAPAVATWRARMINEYASAAVFEALSAQVGAALEGELGRECASFAGEERRHGTLCGAVVEALGGEARAMIPSRPAFPTHAGVPPRAATLRNLIHVSCMSETVAVALIGAERLAMPDGPLRDLLSRIYADEVGHARFGWRVLEAVGDDLTALERSSVERYLEPAFRDLERHELEHLPVHDALIGGAELGLCSGRDARLLFHETVNEVIRPRLRHWFRC